MVKADWTILEKAGTVRTMFIAPKESAIFNTLKDAIVAFNSGLVEVVAAQRRLKLKRKVVKTEANAQQIADGELVEVLFGDPHLYDPRAQTTPACDRRWGLLDPRGHALAMVSAPITLGLC